MFYCTSIGDKEHGVDCLAIHLYRFVGFTVLFARHAANVLRALGYAGPIHIQMGLILWDPLESTCRHASLSIL